MAVEGLGGLASQAKMEGKLKGLFCKLCGEPMGMSPRKHIFFKHRKKFYAMTETKSRPAEYVGPKKQWKN